MAYLGLAPCKDCKNRRIGCHDKCNQYIKWCKDRDKQKEAIQKTKQLESGIAESIVRGMHRSNGGNR